MNSASSSSPRTSEARRMTAPPGSLQLPSGPPRPSGRPPSPLRNEFSLNTGTGIDPDVDSHDDDDPHWLHERSSSPSSSVSQFAAQFAQKVGHFVGGISQSPRSASGHLPSDAELEAEAERERDRSRREAERILSNEAAQRQVEARVQAMLDSTRSLPPPPSRSNTAPNPPSPSGSQRDSLSWWTAAKQKLTPTKEPLTPAQQVIQDVKTKEKQDKKLSKTKNKDEWPANPDTKFNDPTYQNLNIPRTPPTRPTIPNTNTPSPARPVANMQINMTPSPKRTNGSSPARAETVPIYAQFDPDGALDVPTTLLNIARRFEKLEKWTVGHVRALEERMNDVERWLVEKEEEKEKDKEHASGDREPKTSSRSDADVRELREDIAELQGRLGELGREVANLATKNLSSGPSKQSAHLEEGHRAASSFAVHGHTTSQDSGHPRTPSQKLVPSTARESTSPPLASSHTKTPTGGTRLPYPTGDYTSPESSLRSSFSPPTSPSPLRSVKETKPLNLSGMPSSSSASNIGLGIGISQPGAASSSYSLQSFSPASSMADLHSELPPPKMSASSSPYDRQDSASPTPRKRYTVALGAPLVDPLSTHSPSQSPPPGKGAVYLHSTSKSPVDFDNKEVSDEEGEFGGETIGKSAASKLPNTVFSNGGTPSRTRPQSTYGFSTPTSPLKPKKRAKSTDRFASTDSLSSVSSAGSKFVDPLISRRQERQDTIDKLKATQPKVERGKKVGVGQLVAFFDDSKK